MSLQDNNKVKKNLMNLTFRTSFKETIQDNIKQLVPSNKILIILLILIPSIMYISLKIVESKNTIEIIKEINTSLLAIFIGLIAIVVTGYALFQAMISRNHAIKLLSVEDDNKSLLSKFNGYFFILSLGYFVIIILEIAINIFINLRVNNIVIITAHEFIESYILTLYFTINIIFLWEFKSFIYNLYVCFISNVITVVTNQDEAAATKENKN